jgi:hypothetical protein
VKTEISSKIKHPFHTEICFKIFDSESVRAEGNIIIYDIDVEAGPNALIEATTTGNNLKDEIRKLGQVILDEK